VRAHPYNVVGLLIPTIDLSSLNGARRRINVVEKVELPPFGTLTFPAPAAVDLDVERTSSTLSITGVVEVDSLGECGRCLVPVELHSNIEVDEGFEIGADADPFGEGNVVHDNQLDLQDFIRQIVDAALPLSQLCREDCAGLCVTCGNNLNQGSCDCADLSATKGDHG
jgi:uncharacterized protein